MATKMSRLVLRRMKPRTARNLQVDKCIWTLAPRSTPTVSRDYKFNTSNRLLDMRTMMTPSLPEGIDPETEEKLRIYSGMEPTSLSISELIKHGKKKCPKESFLFLRMCLPIRMANMIMELRLLPPELTKQPGFQEVLLDYVDSFKKVLKFEMAEINDETLEEFMQYLIFQRKRHVNTVPNMAFAMKGMINETGTSNKRENFQYFLDRLYLNRISIHLLISNFRELHDKKYRDPNSNLVGVIDPDCDLVRAASYAYEEATFICDRIFFEHPKLQIKGFEVNDVTREVTELKKVTMAYIPSHLHNIFFEIFKNAMRATCEKNESFGGNEKLDDIRCIIYKSKNDITIRISDLGGGISRHIVDRLFDYQFTTAKHVQLEKHSSSRSSVVGLQSPDHPMYGLGYGIPISRLYARYFQGDLRIASIDGYGTDVYIYLQALSEDATEHLPNYSPAAANKLNPAEGEEADWIDKLSLKDAHWLKNNDGIEK